VAILRAKIADDDEESEGFSVSATKMPSSRAEAQATPSRLAEPQFYSVDNISPEARAELLGDRPEAVIAGVLLRNFFPADYFVQFNENEMRIRSVAQYLACYDRYDCSFSFGNNFWPSIKRNGGGKDGAFAHAIFSTCADVISERGTVDIKPFHGGVRDKNDAPQLSKAGGFLAFRAHITKSGPALRLMFWRNGRDEYELSRVGPKRELEID
jgi:hypothetical protein